MKILPLSDLHFEFHADHGKSFIDSLPPADVVVLGGDIGTHDIIVDVLTQFSLKYDHVIMVKGNHDYYNSSFSEVRKILKQFTDKFERKNIHILDNDSVTIDGQRFVGSSLWFPYSPDNYKYYSYMSDFDCIKNFANEVYDENIACVKYLNSTIDKSDIVITHYLPSYKCVAKEWVGSELNRFFVCDIEDIILREEYKLHILAHTHSSMDFKIGATRMICNPYGYHKREVNRNFNENLIIEL